MKYFLISITLGCFSFSVITGAAIHTLIEVQLQLQESRIMASTYLKMPLRELAEVRI